MINVIAVDPHTRVLARLRCDPEFARAMVDEAAELMGTGHAEEAHSILRDVAIAIEMT